MMLMMSIWEGKDNHIGVNVGGEEDGKDEEEIRKEKEKEDNRGKVVEKADETEEKDVEIEEIEEIEEMEEIERIMKKGEDKKK